MLKGSDIPAPLGIAETLDRTLWVFRHRYFPYLIICLLSFGIPFLIILALYVLDILSFDIKEMFEQMDKNPVEAFFAGGFGTMTILIGLPSFFAEIALQFYTSHLVRDREIGWGQAMRMAFSIKTLRYIPVKIFSLFILILFSGLGAFLIFVPGIGLYAWMIVSIAPFSILSGMGAAIVVEEKRGFFRLIGRNVQLAWQKPWVTIFSSGLGFLVVLVFNFSLLALFILFLLIAFSITLGTNDLFAVGSDTGVWIMGVLIFITPMINILFVIPLKSIFYSVLYYNMRSRREAFHLENALDLCADKNQSEVADIKATA